MLYFPLDSPLFFLHFFGLVATAVVSLAAARWVRRQTRDRAGDLMTYLLATHVVMSVALMAQLVTPGPELKGVFRTVWALLLFTNPVAWFLFAVYYTGRDHWLTGPTWAVLGVSVLVPVALVAAQLLVEPVFGEYELRTEPFRHAVATDGEAASLLFLGGFAYNLIGFGLAIVASIAEAHDWTVSVRDAVAGDPGDASEGGTGDRSDGDAAVVEAARGPGARFEVSGVTVV